MSCRKHISKLLAVASFFCVLLTSGNIKANPLPFDSLARKIDLNMFSYEEESREMLGDLYSIARNSPDSARLIAHCLYREASISSVQGLSDSTLFVRIKHRISVTDKNNYPYEHGLLIYSLAQLQDAAGQYAEAFPNGIQALEEFKILNDSLFIGKSLNILGNICNNINIAGMAENYYSDALLWINPSMMDYYGIKMNISMLSFAEGNVQSSIDSLLSLIPEIEALNNRGLLVLVYLNLGFISWDIRDYDNLYAYCEKASQILDTVDNARLEALLNQNFALYYYFGRKNHGEALKYAARAGDIAQKYWLYDQLANAYDLMSEIYGSLNRNDSAYYYLKHYQELNYQLGGNSKIIEAYQAYIATFLESSENKLTIAQQNIELNKKRFTATITIFAFVALLSLLLVAILQQKKRMRENENKELARQLELEKQIQQLEQEKQQGIIESKAREITSYSLQLSNKNNVLKQILDITNQTADKPKDVSDIRKQINTIIKNNYSIDNDWENFKIHFDKVHPDFFDKLKTHCPDLTENNLRNCAYFRLGLSTKQIAQILNISPSSVIIQRSRLKKKLGLAEEVSLDDFLREL